MEKVRLLLGGKPAAVQAAALPWRQTPEGIEVLLITSRGTGRWVLPKGWPEKGESLDASARRESFEEAGIKGEVAGKPAGSYFYGKVLRDGGVRRCQVMVYPLHVEREDESWPEKRQRTRKWVACEEAARMVAEPELANLISHFPERARKTAA